MKYLYNFSLRELLKYVKNNKIDTWWIYDKSIEERYDYVFYAGYCQKLLEMATVNNISHDECEVISWLDGMALLYCGLKYATSKKSDELDNLRVIGELHIPFSNCRADVVLVKDNKILIIEFSYKKKTISRKEKYEEKLNQVMYYKELLSNALPKHIEIATYSFPIEVETDENGNPQLVYSEIAGKKIYKNHDSCYYLGQFIKEFFKHTNKSALDELENLGDNLLIDVKEKNFNI